MGLLKMNYESQNSIKYENILLLLRNYALRPLNYLKFKRFLSNVILS